MTRITMSEGYADFKVPGIPTPCRTWYKTYGDLTSQPPPLVILHGGPGASHDYLLPLTTLHTTYGIPLLFYDQIGCGRSTHLPAKANDQSFWTVSLFKLELANLLTHLNLIAQPIDILGHSWGGMLAAEFVSAAATDLNIRHLVLSNSLASMDAWRTGITALRAALPADVQAVLARCEEKGDFASPEYEAAVEVFYKRHLSLARPWPSVEVQAALESFAGDAESSKCYETMYGPSELTITGSLRDWTSVPLLKDIKVPTLIVNGAQDEATDVANEPFFKHIGGKVRWVTLDQAAHFSHVDQRDKYMKLVAEFLAV